MNQLPKCKAQNHMKQEKVLTFGESKDFLDITLKTLFTEE
jgi:predicted nucleic-acid-binding Zn-ribbon protein